MRSRVLTVGFVTIICFAVSSVASQSKPPAQTKPAPTAPIVIKSPTTDSEKIASALTAAPAAVSANATVVDMDMATMALKTLKKGTNGWTCMPDTPSPGRDPMCVDQNGAEWLNAWIGHKDPPAGKMGFGYMLMGGSDASQTDPFATAPKPGEKWVDTGPHVMIFNIGTSFAGYPTTPGNLKMPWVMFPNTPYAHLMIPVK